MLERINDSYFSAYGEDENQQKTFFSSITVSPYESFIENNNDYSQNYGTLSAYSREVGKLNIEEQNNA